VNTDIVNLGVPCSVIQKQDGRSRDLLAAGYPHERFSQSIL